MPQLAPAHFIPPLPTWFDDHGRVDWRALSWLMDSINQTGIEDIVLLGSTAEAPALSLAEAGQLLRLADDVLDRRLRFHVGTAMVHCDDLAPLLHALRRPVTSLLYYPNLYYRTFPSNAEEYLRYATVCGAPLTPYHLPETTGVRFSPEMIAGLADAGVPLYAVKVSQEKIDAVSAWKREDVYRLWWGSERECQKALDLGAEAIVSQLIAFFPEWTTLGDMSETQRRISILKGVVDKSIAAEHKLSFLKAVRAALGGPDSNAVRPPLRPYSAGLTKDLLDGLR